MTDRNEQGPEGFKDIGIKLNLLPVLLVCIALAGAAIAYALSFPHLSGRFEARAGVAAPDYVTPGGDRWHAAQLAGAAACAAGPVALTGEDLSAHAVLFDRDANAAIARRQAQIRCLLRSPGASVSGWDDQGRHSSPLLLRTRTIADLPGDFWWPLVMGVLAALVSGWVWSLRPRETATLLFAINGLSFLTSFLVQAVYKARAIGYDPLAFEALYVLNDLANQVFYLSLMGLFLHYPIRLATGRGVFGIVAVGVLYAGLLAAMSQAVSLLNLVFGVLELSSIIALIGWQWVRTRRRPRERAALMWLALSVIVGASLWIVLMLLSHGLGLIGLLGEVQVVALFFPFYLGLAMGVARFCLVELQDWTFRLLFFVMAALLFVAIDAALVSVTELASGAALGAALLAVAFLYLPLRDHLWRRFVKGRGMSRPDMFAAVMDIAFAQTQQQRRARWEALVRRLFEPLSLEPIDDRGASRLAIEAVPEARIEANGLRMVLPAVAHAPPLGLAYARQGRELFSPSQLALVRQLIALVPTASTSRDAYERGAADERRRLAQDLHDDVGARLLSGLTAADDRTRPILHGALSDIRAIASGMMGADAPLDRVLADVRLECVRRCEEADIGIDWPLWPDDAPLVLADYRLQKALASALREAVSNIIRHSGAGHVEIGLKLDGMLLTCRIRDDGRGLPEAVLSGEAAGQGLKGLMRRSHEVGGRIRFGNRTGGGTEVEIALPLYSA